MPRIIDAQQLPSLGTIGRFSRKRNRMDNLLEFFAFQDRYFHIDDFTQDTIDLDYYALAKTSGGDEVNFAINTTSGAGHGGIAASTGATAAQTCSAIGPLIYKGDKNVGMWVRFKLDDVTDVEWEVGFVAAVPGSNASAVTDVDTPTVVMTDGAVIHCDTGQTLAIPAFVTEGSTANQGIKATSFGLTPVNDTYMEATIQIQGDDAVATLKTASGSSTVLGFSQVKHNSRATGNTAGYIEGGTAIAPWLFVGALGNAARLMTVDALAIWSDR